MKTLKDSKHIFVIAGEASGDVYGAQLIEALREINPNVRISGLGGDRMEATEMEFLYPLVREFAVMGFIPVVLGIPKVMRFLEIILDHFDNSPPDMVVLIDYPGFNLYLATHTKTRKIPTVYYVTPQIWAWHSSRIHKIKRLISKMLVIFPFEVSFYQEANIPVEYVGHPLLDRLALFTPNENFFQDHGMNPGKMLALLPGSRKREIKLNLPAFLWVACQMSQKLEISNICLALACKKYDYLVQKIVQYYTHRHNLPEIKIIYGKTYDVVHHSHLTLVVSGTACLEAAMLGNAMTVVYRIPKFHKWVVDHTAFVKCKYFSLPNIISGKKIVTEHLIATAEPKGLLEESCDLWENSFSSERQRDFQKLRESLQSPGASKNAARAIWELLA